MNAGDTTTRLIFSRRAFLVGAASMTAVTGFNLRSAALAHAFSPAPLVALHMDLPYVNRWGNDVPYVPAIGAQGAALDHLSDAQLRMHHCYL